MEHEEAYILMMDTLDGQLTAAGRESLAAHIAECGQCAREWQMLAAVDTLFQQAPLVEPAAGFTARTLKRLAGAQQRRMLLGGFFLMLLVVGFLPLLGIGWLRELFDPLMSQPALQGGMMQILAQLAQIGTAVLLASWQLLSGMLIFLQHQPLALLTLGGMIGSMILWQYLYMHLLKANVMPQRPRIHLQ